jgi:hypothetical protein
MNAPAHDTGRLALMLNELRLPTIGRLWPEFAERSDKEGWQASRLLGALLGMTVAAIDRLVHHSTIFELNVESYRRRKASDKQNARRRQLPDDNSPPFSGQLPDDDNVTQ